MDHNISATAVEKKADKKRKSLPKACIAIYIVLGISIVSYIVAMLSTPYADFVNRTVGVIIRSLLAYITGWFPFSLAEIIIVSSPIIVVWVIIKAYKNYCGSWHDVLVYTGILFSAVALVIIVFIWGFSAGYRTTPINEKMGIERDEVSVEELADTMRYLTEKVNELSAYCFFEESGSSAYHDVNTTKRINKEILESYSKVCEEYEFIQKSGVRTKSVLFSEAMSYMHITGVYTFFTGEANINVDFPHYTIPFTVAHEMAHQRGIAREDEANFVAYLVCINSDYPYLQYSGYLSMYEYVANALYSSDKELYKEIRAQLSGAVSGELAAYSEFFKKYSDSAISKVSGAVNDTYLQIQGTVGSKSYGLVVDLAVAYYKSLMS